MYLTVDAVEIFHGALGMHTWNLNPTPSTLEHHTSSLALPTFLSARWACAQTPLDPRARWAPCGAAQKYG